MIKEAIVECHDRIFRHSDSTPLSPPWDVTVVPLSSGDSREAAQLLVVFSYSHSHGDGTSGLTFHRTFIRGMNGAQAQDTNLSSVYDTIPRPLLPAFDQVADLTVSWNCLFGAALYDRLPTFMRTSLGLHPISPATPNTWLAKPKLVWNSVRTGLDILVLEGTHLTRLLSACQVHNARITGLLHQLIVRSLRQAVAKHSTAQGSKPEVCDIVATTPLNLRHLAPQWASPAEMVMAVSATTELFAADPLGDDTMSSSNEDFLWAGAKETGSKLVAAASTLHDQPVALLRYVSDFRSWMTGQLGKISDCSYEVSNIMSFDPDTHAPPRPPVTSSDVTSAAASLKGEDSEGGWKVGNMYFSQPASVMDSPLNFGVVSRKGGDLVICLTWQVGVLGVEDEDAFTQDILSGVRSQIATIISEA